MAHRFDSIKLIAESAELGPITDEAAAFLSSLVAKKLRTLIEESDKFRSHFRRKKLLTKDIDYALKSLNIPPLLGFYSNEIIPFKFSTAGGREIFYYDDEEIDLTEVIARVNIPKLPQDIAIKSHWLAIDGVQPAIPENPPPLDRDQQRLDCIDPLRSLSSSANDKRVHHPVLKRGIEAVPTKRTVAGKNALRKHVEVVRVKQLATHELSVEQQLYYKEITEACVGSIEIRRQQALTSLSNDPGLHQMLPRLCTFISEGVKVNVIHSNLALLIYLMRMVKSLLENQTLYLEKYLHELCPTVITCIVSKQICIKTEDNHYALRDFASKLLANMCKTYNSSANSLQTRITRLLCKALDLSALPLTSVYGALSALCELGTEVQRSLVLCRIKRIGERLKPPHERSEIEHLAQRIRSLLLTNKYLPMTLKENRPPPDIVEDYTRDFGFLGSDLCAAVIALRRN